MPTDSRTGSASLSSISRRSFLRRSAFTMAAAAAGPALLTACGSTASGSGGGGEKITFLSYLPLETLSMTPELLAVAGGHFARHGLDVTLQPVKGSPQAMQTLLSGSGIITRLGQIDVMGAVAESAQPLVGLASLTKGSTQRFVYSKKNHPLNRPEDFLGQTMGIPSEGGTSDKLVSLVVANAGLDPKQVKRQVVGLTPGTFNLVQQGRIAGYVVSIDTANAVVAQNDDAGVYNPGQNVKSDSQVYVATKDSVQGKAGTLRAFLAAIKDSVGAIVADTGLDDTLKQLRGKYSFGSLDDDKVAKASLRELREAWSANSPLLSTDKAAWSAGYAELAAAGLVKPGGDAAAWIDNSLLPAS